MSTAVAAFAEPERPNLHELVARFGTYPQIMSAWCSFVRAGGLHYTPARERPNGGK